MAKYSPAVEQLETRDVPSTIYLDFSSRGERFADSCRGKWFNWDRNAKVSAREVLRTEQQIVANVQKFYPGWNVVGHDWLKDTGTPTGGLVVQYWRMSDKYADAISIAPPNPGPGQNNENPGVIFLKNYLTAAKSLGARKPAHIAYFLGNASARMAGLLMGQDINWIRNGERLSPMSAEGLFYDYAWLPREQEEIDRSRSEPFVRTQPDVYANIEAAPAFRFRRPQRPQRGKGQGPDTYLRSQWGLEQNGVNVRQVWPRISGSMKTKVAVIDTGIDYTHPDLYLNIWVNQGELPGHLRERLREVDGDDMITLRDINGFKTNKSLFTDANRNGYIDGYDLLRWRSDRRRNPGGAADGQDNDGNGFTDDLVGWDFVGDDNNPFDEHSHGTHVAGTIGAISNNRLGVAGVNWKVSLIPVQVLNFSGFGSWEDVAAGIDYATRMNADVANMSLGGPDINVLVVNALNRAQDAGLIVVAAAGNDGRPNPIFPASWANWNVVSVAATTRYGTKADFSNYGSKVEVAAPGADILSTVPGSYESFDGTSMAAPHVAGVLALAFSLEPNLDPKTAVDLMFASTRANDFSVYGSVDAAAFLGKL